MAADRMFGLETEYAFSALGPNGEALERATWCTRFMDLAFRRLRNLPDKHGGGVFLETGGRFYRDSGNHPELTTPEVVDPWELCRYVAAGDRALRGVADELVAAGGGIGQVVLSRHNVSYGAYQSTWACHESYSHRASLETMPQHLIPHLVTRIVCTGAGGFNNRSPAMEFLLSPRVAHLHSISSDSSQSSRGIYHTKNEQLNDQGYHRLHILCGESVCSERSNWLKVATTALVVAMIEAGLNPGDGLWPADPVKAIRGIAGDVSLTHRFRCSDGRERTAIDVQRHYLELASRHSRAAFMPDWNEEACRLWRQELDRLSQGIEAVSRRLDWAIKLKVFQQTAARAGIAWETIPVWNQVLITLINRLIELQVLPEARRADVRVLSAASIGTGNPLYEEARRLTPLLTQHGLSWSQLDTVVRLRQQLFELDTRFSEVGPRGVFSSLHKSGVLDHHVPGVDNIEEAMSNPPSRGRARLRGDCVKRFAARRTEFTASWMGVWDEAHGRFLNLSDPFQSNETWIDEAERPAGAAAEIARQSAFVLTRITELYDKGDYGQAIQFGDFFRRSYPQIPPSERSGILRMLAFAQARRGDAQAIDLMTQSLRLQPRELPAQVDMMCVCRFLGLVPDERISITIEQCQASIAEHPGPHGRSIAAFRDHYSYFLMCRNRLSEARAQIESFRQTATHSDACARVLGRIHATLAEIDRRQGRYEEAHAQVRMARELQTRSGCVGDLAEFAMMMEARLELDHGRRLGILRTALQQQKSFKHTLGEARTLLLMARVGVEPTERAAIRNRIVELQGMSPALQNCPLTRKALDQWPEWVSARPISGATEFFGGV